MEEALKSWWWIRKMPLFYQIERFQAPHKLRMSPCYFTKTPMIVFVGLTIVLAEDLHVLCLHSKHHSQCLFSLQ